METMIVDPIWRPPTIATARLVLRALYETDAEALFKYAKDPEMTRYVSWDAHADVEFTRGYIAGRVREQYLLAVPNPMAICLNDEIIGALGGFWANQSSMCMEIGYWLGRPHWGQGYSVEAAQALLRYLFEHYTVERIQAHCVAENTSSARVMQKLGMAYEGTTRKGHHRRGRFWDLHWYSILREEWEAGQS